MTTASAIDRRARLVGISKAALCRETGVPYHKLVYGYTLREDEVAKLDAVLSEHERRMARYRSAAYVA